MSLLTLNSQLSIINLKKEVIFLVEHDLSMLLSADGLRRAC